MIDDVTVIKLGGSHALSPLLGGLLRAIRKQAGRMVLVPGGGPFADTVRIAQTAMKFSDDAAHDMALMAMAQYGRVLVELVDGCVHAEDLGAVRDAARRGLLPVWSPWPMLRGHPDIPRGWDVTSDSLAVWLAAALGAARVVLIKHRTPPADRSPAALVRDGLVDAAFPRFVAGFHGSVTVVDADDLADGRAIFGAPAAA